MYRGFIKEIYNLTGMPIGNSDLRVLRSNIKRDILTKASSSFEVLGIPEEAKNGHIFGCYDDYGKIRYLGVISNIDGNTIQTDQIISIFDDNWLWNNPKEITIEQTIKTILETDFQNNPDTMVSTIFSQFDIVIESSGTQLVLGSQDSQYVKNFMNLIFDIYEKYQIIIDINIYYKNQRPQIIIRKPEFETIKIIDNNYAINNINVMKETYETNKLIVYSSEGIHRGTWYGTVNGITDDDDYTNRLPKIKTNIAFSDDDISIIKAQNLRNQMYNHKIEVQLLMNNKLYNFDEFNLGQTFHIYHKKDMYESILTGYEIGMDQNGYSDVVTLIFGIVRVSLVDKLNKLTDAARSITQNYAGGGGGGGSSNEWTIGDDLILRDTNGDIIAIRHPENLVFYDGEGGDEIANNFMFAKLTGIHSLTTSFTSPSWQQVKKGGNGFEISNGSIKCNKNGKVRVIANGILSRASNSSTDMEQRICLNGVYVDGTIVSITQAWSGNATSVGILDVKEGDLINVLVKTNATAANYLGASQMICEYIEEYYITKTTIVPDLEAVYPVGSIYMSVNNTNPYELFGFGTWTQIKDVFLLGAGDNYNAGETGGEAEHILTVNEMPSHSHRYGQYKGNAGWSGDSPQPNFMKNTGNDGYSTTDTNGYMATLNSGGGQAHNNMPPYLVVYMWQRVS